jgi:hypothetical protein
MAATARAKAVEVPATQNVTLDIPPIDVRRMSIRIVGDSALISHKWSESR